MDEMTLSDEAISNTTVSHGTARDFSVSKQWDYEIQRVD
jgi:hypothetical protein